MFVFMEIYYDYDEKLISDKIRDHCKGLFEVLKVFKPQFPSNDQLVSFYLEKSLDDFLEFALKRNNSI